MKKNFSWCLSFHSRGFLCLVRLYFFLLKEKGILESQLKSIREDGQLNQEWAKAWMGISHLGSTIWLLHAWDGHSGHTHFAGVPPLRSLETWLPSSKVSGFQSLPDTTGSSSPLYHPLISGLLPKYYQAFSAFLLPQFLKAPTHCLFSHDLYNPHSPATWLPPQSVPENSLSKVTNDSLTSKSKILFKILILLNP